MRVIGLDIGSRTVKRVTLDDEQLIEFDVMPNNHDPLSVCDTMLSGRDADRIVATGYGRRLFTHHRESTAITEIKAAALGARYFFSNARIVLDIGGQDTKVVALAVDGSVSKFEMNDRCAAGTGRFLEVMATALSYRIHEFVQASLSVDRFHKINAMCTVFAESEVISAMAQGVDRAELARGLHDAVARRAAGMLRRTTISDDVVFCGGGALNDSLRDLIAREIQHEVHIPQHPQITAALGAALSAFR